MRSTLYSFLEHSAEASGLAKGLGGRGCNIGLHFVGMCGVVSVCLLLGPCAT